jgi:hypothetical protein
MCKRSKNKLCIGKGQHSLLWAMQENTQNAKSIGFGCEYISPHRCFEQPQNENPMLGPQSSGFIVCVLHVVNLDSCCEIYWLISVQSTRDSPLEREYMDTAPGSHYSPTAWYVSREIFHKYWTKGFDRVTDIIQKERTIGKCYKVSGFALAFQGLFPLLWSSGQCFSLQTPRSRVRFPALLDFLNSSGPGTGSIRFFYWNPGQPRTLLQLKLVGILTINLFLT